MNPHAEQLSRLEQLVASMRILINEVVQTNAAANDLENISLQVEQLNAQLAALPKGRSIAHYDLSQAKTRTNFTLPYSPVCGPFNPIAPPVNMHYDAALDHMVGHVICSTAYEGPKNMVHGAVIAGIYDQLLALVSSSKEQPSYTAYLKVDYKKPTPLHQPLEFRAWTDRMEGRKMYIKGICTYQKETVTECEGLFIQMIR